MQSTHTHTIHKYDTTGENRNKIGKKRKKRKKKAPTIFSIIYITFYD